MALAPSLEQGAIFNNFNFAAGLFGNEAGYTIQHGNDTLIAVQLATLICPSDGTTQRPQAPWGMTNYVGNVGGPGQLAMFTGTIVSNPVWSGSQTRATPVRFRWRRSGRDLEHRHVQRAAGRARRRPRGEREAKQQGLQARGLRRPDRSRTAAIIRGWWGPRHGSTLARTCPERRQSPTYISGCYWLAGYPLHTVVNGYLHAGTPNGPSCNNPAGPSFVSLSWIFFVNPQGSAPPTSNHPGGVNVGMADGSVKFIKDTVNMQTWWALGTRDGGEAVSATPIDDQSSES